MRIVLDTAWVPCGSRDGVDQREHVAGQMPPVDGVEQPPTLLHSELDVAGLHGGKESVVTRNVEEFVG